MNETIKFSHPPTLNLSAHWVGDLNKKFPKCHTKATGVFRLSITMVLERKSTGTVVDGLAKGRNSMSVDSVDWIFRKLCLIETLGSIIFPNSINDRYARTGASWLKGVDHEIM